MPAYTRGKPDIHPDDEAARRQLQADYTAARNAARMSHADVGAKLNISSSGAANFQNDNRADPMAATVQRYARAIGCQFTLRLEGLEHLGEPPHDATSKMLDALADRGDPQRADELHLWRFVALLVRTRNQLKLRQVDIAAALGCSPSAVKQIELDGKSPRLSTLMRYARALGGRVTLHLDPVNHVQADAA